MSASEFYAMCQRSTNAAHQFTEFNSNNTFTNNCGGLPAKPKKRRRRKRHRSPKNRLKKQNFQPQNVQPIDVYLVPTQKVVKQEEITVMVPPTAPKEQIRAGPGFGPSRPPKTLKPVQKKLLVNKVVEVPLWKPVARVNLSTPTQPTQPMHFPQQPVQFSEALLQTPLAPVDSNRIKRQNDEILAEMERQFQHAVWWEARERIQRQIGEAQYFMNIHAEKLKIAQEKADAIRRTISAACSEASSMSSDRLPSDVSESVTSDFTDGSTATSTSRKAFITLEASIPQACINIPSLIARDQEMEVFFEDMECVFDEEIPQPVFSPQLTAELLEQVSLPELGLAEKIQKHASYGSEKHVQFSFENNTYHTPRYMPNRELFFSFEDEMNARDEVEREERANRACMQVTCKLARSGRANKHSKFQCDCEIHQQQSQVLFHHPERLFICDCRYCKLFEHYDSPQCHEEKPYSRPPIKRGYRALNRNVPVNFDAQPDLFNSLEEAVQTVSEEREDDHQIQSQANAAALGLLESTEDVPSRTGTAEKSSIRNWGDKKWSTTEFDTCEMQKLQRSQRVDDAWTKSQSLVKQFREPTPEPDDEGWVPCGAPNLRMTNLPGIGYDFNQALHDYYEIASNSRKNFETAKKDIIWSFKKDAKHRLKGWFLTQNIRLAWEERLGISIKQDFNDSNRYFLACGWVTFEDTKQRFELAERLVNSKKEGNAVIFGNQVVEFSWAWQDPKKRDAPKRF